MTTRHVFKFFSVMVLASLAAKLNATDITWTNGNGNGQWNTAANWSSNSVPTSTDNAIISATSSPTLQTNVTVASLSVSGTFAVNVPTGLTLTVTSLALNNGNITGAGTLIVNGTFVSDNSTGTNSVNTIVTNNGAITVNSGRLDFLRSVTNNGTVTATNANTIAAVNGNNSPVFLNQGAGSFTGTFLVDTNAVLRVNNNFNFTGTLITTGNNGNSIDGSGSLTIDGMFNVADNVTLNTLPITLTATSTLLFNRGTNSDGILTLINNATLVVNGDATFTQNNGISIASGSTVTFNKTVSFNESSITNPGNLVISSACVFTSTNVNGTNSIHAQTTNQGSVVVSSGRLDFLRSVQNTGSVTATAAGTIASVNGNNSPIFTNTGTGSFTGTFVVDTNAKLRVDNAFSFTGTLILNGNGGNSIDGAGSLAINGTFRVADGATLSTLPVTVNAGGSLLFNAGTNANGQLGLISNATLTANCPVTFTQSNGINIASGSTVTMTDTVALNQSNITGSGTLSLTSSAILTSTNISGTNNLTSVVNNDGSVIVSSGTLNIGSSFVQTGGSLQLGGGNISGTVNLQGGTLSGSGTITGNVTNGGTIAPGSSPGSITITGNYTQTSGGKMMMEIGGALPADFDSMTISGSATLDGTFEVTLINSYVPPAGQQFDSMVFASRTGTFSTYTNNGGNLSLSVDNTAVRQVSTSLNPTPTISSLVPSSIDAGSGDSAIVVIGTNFISGTIVRLGGQDRPTLIISSTEVLVLLPAADVATAGTANITAFNGAPGGGTSAAAVLTIGSSGGGGTTLADTDGDGFSDSIEVAAGTSASNALETPVNNQPAPDPLPLPDVKLGIKLNFSKAGSDAIGLSGTLLLSEGFDVAGKTFLVDVGGVARSFTLDAKGSSKNGNDSAGIKSKGTAARTGKFAVKLNKGSFATTLANVGLNDADVSKDVNVSLAVVIDGKLYQKTQAQTYKAKAGKGGATKDKK